jgi:hypothetical protein
MLLGRSDASRCLISNSLSLVWRVVELRLCCELLSKGRKWVDTWRTTARGFVPGLGDSRGVACLGVVTNGTSGECLDFTVLSSMALAVLLIIGGVEQNPGPDVEVENTVRLSCTGCGRNLKSGIQCDLCGRW